MTEVLVVDDDVGFRETSTRMLALDGYHVAAADSVAAARARLSLALPDALLLDWKLPDGTGLDVLQWADARKNHIPTALITGFWADPNYGAAEADARRLGVKIIVKRGRDFDEPGEIVRRLLDTQAILHASVLRGDEAARERIAAELAARIVPRLQTRFPLISPDLVRAGALDAIMDYVDRPSRFSPVRDMSVERYVYKLARRRLWNDLRGESRRRERENQYALLRRVIDASPSRRASSDQAVIASVISRESDLHVRIALRAWLGGDTSMSPWLEVPAIATLLPREQHVDVARRKDKFTARVKRQARRLMPKK